MPYFEIPANSSDMVVYGTIPPQFPRFTCAKRLKVTLIEARFCGKSYLRKKKKSLLGSLDTSQPYIHEIGFDIKCSTCGEGFFTCTRHHLLWEARLLFLNVHGTATVKQLCKASASQLRKYVLANDFWTPISIAQCEIFPHWG